MVEERLPGLLVCLFGSAYLGLSSYLAESQAGLLNRFWEVELSERAIRIYMWSLRGLGVAIVLVGMAIVAFGDAVYGPTSILAEGDEPGPFFTGAVVVFMLGTFVLTVVLTVRVLLRQRSRRRDAP